MSMVEPMVLVVDTRAVIVGATGMAIEVRTKVVDRVEDQDDAEIPTPEHCVRHCWTFAHISCHPCHVPERSMG